MLNALVRTLIVLSPLEIAGGAEVELRRIDDPALVATLEAEVSRRQATLDVDILCDNPLKAWSEPAYEVLRANRPRVLVRLREILARAVEAPPDDNEFGRGMTVQAVLRIMMIIAPEEGLDTAIALQDQDDLRTGLFRSIRTAPRELIDARPELWDMVAGSLRDRDRGRRVAALSAAVAIDPERAAPRVRAAIGGNDNERRQLDVLLATAMPASDALDAFIAHAESASVWQIAQFADHDDPDIRRRAREYLDRRGKSAIVLSRDRTRLEPEGAAAVPRLIEIMQDDQARDYVRYKAMRVVVEHRGLAMPEVRATAREMLSAADVEPETVSELAGYYGGSGDEETTRLLLAIAHRSAEELESIDDDTTSDHRTERRQVTRRLAATIEAMLHVGGEGVVDRASRFYDDESAMPIRLRWARRGLDNDALLEHLRTSGLAPEASFDRCEYHDHASTPMDLAVDLLATSGAGVRFDAEADDFPVRHDKLVLQFAAGSAGLFRPTAVDQVDVPDPAAPRRGKYRVRIVVNGRYYEFQANRGGDWYDTGAVVPSVNAILADLGAPRRFYQFKMGQFLGYVCATPEQAAVLRDDFEIGLYDEPSTVPVDRARAFEDEVRRRLEGGVP